VARSPRVDRVGASARSGPEWIITTHDVADFDAVASSFAARRLYPQAQVLRRRLYGTSERAFLTLHKDRFSALPFEQVDQDGVAGWIVVDVRRRSRLTDFARLLQRVDAGDPKLEVHVWDHHASSEDDLRGHVEHVEPIGAATTLLVEAMRARSMTVDPIEATLFALGIHADTGSLTYATTTPRDAEALAWLMGSGAKVSMLDRYLRPALDPAQQSVLIDLLGGIEEHPIAGIDVAISTVTMEETIGGLSVVTSQACAVGRAEAFFGLFVLGERGVQVVGRSNRSVLDVGAVMRELGGGGHAEAGSARIRDQSIGEVKERLLAALSSIPPRPRTVRELMSSPVHAVQHDESLADIAERLAAWHHTGAPVVRDGKLVGVLSRRDIERAAAAGRERLPASGWMSAPPRTIDPNASLDEALALMTRHDVGRLPVVDGEEIVGIVSRTDVLAALYA
jgi:tRNA nucleotidyltransferase (CCA-adding enzyme)